MTSLQQILRRSSYEYAHSKKPHPGQIWTTVCYCSKFRKKFILYSWCWL